DIIKKAAPCRRVKAHCWLVQKQQVHVMHELACYLNTSSLPYGQVIVFLFPDIQEIKCYQEFLNSLLSGFLVNIPHHAIFFKGFFNTQCWLIAWLLQYHSNSFSHIKRIFYRINSKYVYFSIVWRD